MTHRIRLRGGWDLAERDGQIVSIRRFGRPRTLDAEERVWFVWDHSPTSVVIMLNGVIIGTVSAGEPTQFELTPHLNPRNELQLIGPPLVAMGEVALEIRNDG